MDYKMKYGQLKDFLKKVGYKYVVICSDNTGTEEMQDDETFDIKISGVHCYIAKSLDEMVERTQEGTVNCISVNNLDCVVRERSSINRGFNQMPGYLFVADLSKDWEKYLHDNKFEVYFDIKHKQLSDKLNKQKVSIEQCQSQLQDATKRRQTTTKELEALEQENSSLQRGE